MIGGVAAVGAATYSRINITEAVQQTVHPPEPVVIEQNETITDDCIWREPTESPFDWKFDLDSEAHIRPHPNEGRVEFVVGSKGQTAQMELGGNRALNLNSHADYRLDIVEHSNQPHVGSAWEFFFMTVGQGPWVLIDAGGGDGVSTTQEEDNSSGTGFYTRRDQVLTKYRDQDGNKRYSWDEFADAPLDHSTPRRLSLELLGSEGIINAYVDGTKQASLKEAEGQFVLDSGYVIPMMKLHIREDTQERGFVHQIQLTKL